MGEILQELINGYLNTLRIIRFKCLRIQDRNCKCGFPLETVFKTVRISFQENIHPTRTLTQVALLKMDNGKYVKC